MRLWPFGRSPRDVRGECGNWRSGELAVCICDRWNCPCEHNPAKGAVLLVVEVYDRVQGGVLTRGLGFAGKPADCFWDARGFRKVVRDDQPASADFRLPIHRHEEVDA